MSWDIFQRRHCPSWLSIVLLLGLYSIQYCSSFLLRDDDFVRNVSLTRWMKGQPQKQNTTRIMTHEEIFDATIKDSIYSGIPSPQCRIHQEELIENYTSNSILPITSFVNYSTGISKSECVQQKIKKKYIIGIENYLKSLSPISFNGYNLDHCYEFINSSQVRMVIGDPNAPQKYGFQWFLYLNSHACFNYTDSGMYLKRTYDYSRCNMTENLFIQCSRQIDQIPSNLTKLSPNASTALSSSEIKFEIMPTITWSCFDMRRGIYESNMLYSLWIINESLPKYCESLLCNGYNQDYHDIALFEDTYFFQANYSSDFRNCLNASTNHIFVNNDTYLFSFEVHNENILFMVSKDKLVYHHYIFYILLLYAKDEHIKQCCTERLNLEDLHYGNVNYILCTSNSDICKNSEKLWTTELIKDDYYLVYLRNDIVNSRLYQRLATLKNINRNLSFIFQIFNNLDYEYSTTAIFYPRCDIFTFKDVTEDKKKQISFFFDEINEKNMCKETEYITICQLTYTCMFFVFLHNCSLTLPQDDKSSLLIVNQAFNLGLNEEYLCKNNTGVVRTHSILRISRIINQGLFLCDLIMKQHDFKHWCQEILRTNDKNVGITFTIFPLFKDESTINLFSNFSSVNKTHPIYKPSRQLSFQNRFLSEFLYFFNYEPVPTIPILDYVGKSQLDLESWQHLYRTKVHADIFNNTQCAEDILNGRFSFQFNVPKQIKFMFGPIPSDRNKFHCLKSIPYDILRNDIHYSFNDKTLTVNKFWPTCSYNMLIKWRNNTPVILDWDYLSFGCKVKEIVLFIVSFLITLIPVLGNMFVLIVLIRSNLLRENYFLIQFSMAIADLLLGLIPGSLAVCEHYALMRGSLTLNSFLEGRLIQVPFSSVFETHNRSSDFSLTIMQQAKGFRFERDGYPMISSLVMNISIYVSMFSLALCSIERIQIIRHLLSYTSKKIKRAIISSWILATVFSVSVNYRDEGGLFKGYFDPITKLTMNIGTGEGSFSTISFYIQICIFLITGIPIVILPFISIIIYHKKEKEPGQIMRVHEQLRTKRLHPATLTLLYMVIRFVIVSIPIIIDMTLDLGNKNPIAHYIAWWIFMCGASSNWMLYAFRSTKFRNAAYEVFCCLCVKIKREEERPSRWLQMNHLTRHS